MMNCTVCKAPTDRRVVLDDYDCTRLVQIAPDAQFSPEQDERLFACLDGGSGRYRIAECLPCYKVRERELAEELADLQGEDE